MREIEKIITDLANKEYPKDFEKDIDGDYIDQNNNKRNAFILGCYTMVEIFAKGLSKKRK